ncbi:MAG: response regulator [Proteobacteria bacterium]|nr:response regulator [Pseudomonadota bacterium]
MEAKLSGTLLIVDDEPEIREIVGMHLTALGVTLIEASDGHHALDILRTQPVDVVVSDLMMPRMTGLALLSSMRSEGLMQPFIFLTAYPSQDTTVQALRLGAFDYLEKPFEGDELRGFVKEAMRVAKEMKRLNEGAAQATDTGGGHESAAQQIRKLRTLRYEEAHGKSNEPLATGNLAQRKIEELFISEATAQLLFCGGSIKNLSNPEERAIELGYLFRVMQGIADAAVPIGATRLVDLMRAAEHFFTALRVRPHMVSRELIELATNSNQSLQAAVTTLGKDDGSVDVDATIEAFAQATAKVESGG